MAKVYNKQNRIDVANLSQKDKDILTLDVKDIMKKYKLERQPVYDRRYALNKKISEAGLTVDQLINGKAEVKRGRPKKDKSIEKPVPEALEVMVLPKEQVPIVMKPIEINFDNFSIKLNGVPKSISVNPDTNAIEIDL